MIEQNFELLEKRLQELYQQGYYAGVYQLATKAGPEYPEHTALLSYWRICMAARMGQDDLAIQLLEEKLQSGFWYGEVLLRKSPSLKTLQDNPEFEDVVAKNNELIKRDNAQRYPLIMLRNQELCHPDAGPCPLLIALHSNASTAQDSLSFWKPAAQAGWLVAAPQSSQAMWKNSYVWNDQAITEEEIQKHYYTLFGQYRLNEDQNILAGHSMGGEMALWLALKKSIPVKGVIMVGPGGPRMDDLDLWDGLIGDNINRPLRVYIIFGKNDLSIPQENVRKLTKLLDQSGILTRLLEIPGVGHDYSPEYDDALISGLAFTSE